MASSGQPVKLSRPLDFLVVADHSDNMGFFPDLFAGEPEMLADPTGKRWYDMIQAGKGQRGGARDHRQLLAGHVPEGALLLPGHARVPRGVEGRRSTPPTRPTTRAASPPSSATSGRRTPAATTCTATSSSATAATRPSQVEPFTTLRRRAATTRATSGSGWTAYEEKTGGDVLAIAHNGNLCNGIDVPDRSSRSPASPSTASTRRQRAKWEPLYEVTQIKGDGEAHPFLSPNDEFADYERWDKGNLDLSEAKTHEMLEFEYARSALKNGLMLEAQARRQPVQVRHDRQRRDAHTGLAAVEEDNFFGKTTPRRAEPERARRTRS